MTQPITSLKTLRSAPRSGLGLGLGFRDFPLGNTEAENLDGRTCLENPPKSTVIRRLTA